MLPVLGGLAEFEREPIRIRTGEGRGRAKANGQSLGRKPQAHPAPAAGSNSPARPRRTSPPDRAQLQC